MLLIIMHIIKLRNGEDFEEGVKEKPAGRVEREGGVRFCRGDD